MDGAAPARRPAFALIREEETSGWHAGPGPVFDAALQAQKFKWVFFTGTCYFKIWWQVITTKTKAYPGDPSPTVTTSIDDQSWQWSPVSDAKGYCLPDSDSFNASDWTTWNFGPENLLVPDEPDDPDSGAGRIFPNRYRLPKKIHWSFIEGYEPAFDPTSGTYLNQGFPPAA